jgi:nicotinate-nucleotide pyrophosphorylase (carboxylating)
MSLAPPVETLRRLVDAALSEDLDTVGDITTDAVIPPGTLLSAEIRSRGIGRVAGVDVAALTFAKFPEHAAAEILRADGSDVLPGDSVIRVTGSARTILTAERTILNVLSWLSGIASATALVVRQVAGTRAVIKDTRKTTPGLRSLERYAVAIGGGVNHRSGLYDAVLIKDNHIGIAGSITTAVQRSRAQAPRFTPVQVEIDTLEQLEEALRCQVDAVLLDNMAPDELRRAVLRVDGRCHTEASGGITPENVRDIAETGVDAISLGWLTHSSRALDLGMDLVTGER